MLLYKMEKEMDILKKICTVAMTLCMLLSGCGVSENSKTVPPAVKNTVQSTEKTDAKKTEDASQETTKSTTKKTTAATTADTEVPPETAPPEPVSVIISDNSAEVAVREDGSFSVDFAYGCNMVFPKEWGNRVKIRDDTVYAVNCMDPEFGGGELFSVDCRTEAPQLSGHERYLLGDSESGYLFATVPQSVSYDSSNADMYAEYSDLETYLEGVFTSAVCNASPADFSPVSLADYTNPPDSPDVELYTGTWEAYTQDWTEETLAEVGVVQSWPYLIFCSDGTLAYQCFRTVYEGTYIYNTNDGTEFAIGFINGTILMVDICHMVMTVRGMPAITELAPDGDPHNTNTWTFMYWTDNQKFGLDDE